MNAVMWVCVDDDKVLYQSQFGDSGWHGYCKSSECGVRLKLLFDCRGDESKLKSVRLTRGTAGMWTGYDYAARHITMTYKETQQYCSRCQAWHTKTVA